MSETKVNNLPDSTKKRPFWPVVLILLAMILIGWLYFRSRPRPLKPLHRPTTPALIVANALAESVTFTELNADPAAYLNRRIRVSGSYFPLSPPDCQRFSGLDVRWGLIAEGLQLNAVGFEQLLRKLPAGTEMTVEGIWQRYTGPQGCGKEPERTTVWYLRVEQILQPNPLVVSGEAVVEPLSLDTLQTPTPFQPPVTGDDVTPVATTAVSAPTIPPSPTSVFSTPGPLFTPLPPATATPTTAVSPTSPTQPTATVPPPQPTATPTTNNTTSNTPTPSPGTTPPPSPTSGPTPPPLPTSTPGGYPEPPTPTPPSYP